MADAMLVSFLLALQTKSLNLILCRMKWLNIIKDWGGDGGEFLL